MGGDAAEADSTCQPITLKLKTFPILCTNQVEHSINTPLRPSLKLLNIEMRRCLLMCEAVKSRIHTLPSRYGREPIGARVASRLRFFSFLALLPLPGDASQRLPAKEVTHAPSRQLLLC